MSLMVALPSTVVAQTGSAGGVEQEILKLEKTWLQATQDSRPENAAPLFADNAVFTDSSGTLVGKAGELNEMNKVKWDSAVDNDMKVIPHGKTVIVTGTFQGKGKDDRGKKVDVNERWTDVWMKTTHNGWQVVASHSSPVKD
jgi:ketosteroid isomerase-like protein